LFRLAHTRSHLLSALLRLPGDAAHLSPGSIFWSIGACLRYRAHASEFGGRNHAIFLLGDNDGPRALETLTELAGMAWRWESGHNLLRWSEPIRRRFTLLSGYVTSTPLIPMPRVHKIFLLLLTAFLPFLASPAYAQTCTTEWANPIDGDWSDDANWTNQAPEASSVACITAAGTYTVALGRITATVAELVLGGDSGMQRLTSLADLFVTDARVGPNGRLELLNRTPGGGDGLYSTGAVTVEGLFIQNGGTSFLSDGGTLVIESKGILRLVGGAGAGNEIDQLVLRGTVEGDCASSCAIRSPLVSEAGTVQMIAGELEFQAGGTLGDLHFEVPAGTTVTMGDLLNGAPYVMEGTISGDPAPPARPLPWAAPGFGCSAVPVAPSRT
jgi:hypothetical protein